jgi:hypothetical protein
LAIAAPRADACRSIVFNNVPATQQVFRHVAQTGGATWRWFQTRISYLPILIAS